MIRLLSTQPSGRAPSDLKLQDKSSCACDLGRRPSTCHQPSVLEAWDSSTRKMPICHELEESCPILPQGQAGSIYLRVKLPLTKTQRTGLISIAPRTKSMLRKIAKLEPRSNLERSSPPHDRDITRSMTSLKT
jgi:hypothetical protein